MAKYSDIKGFTVQTLSRITVASQFAGGSWASGGNLNTARDRWWSGGTNTAAINLVDWSSCDSYKPETLQRNFLD